MQYKFTILIFSLSVLIGSKCFAQYNNVWAFGIGAGIDFNYNPPRAIKTSISQLEGSASVCDADGKLLFYTDGTDVWNRDHNLMLNGRNLPDMEGRVPGYSVTNSSAQAALIVPMPGDSSKYYIFSLSEAGTGGYDSGNWCFLWYSIVDMELDNGLGAVHINHKGIIIDSLLTEQMTAVSGIDCNIWLLVMSSRKDSFKAYNIDLNGINLRPNISAILASEDGGWQSAPSVGTAMAVAPNGDKLAFTRKSGLLLYDFDPASGKLSKPVVLDYDYYRGAAIYYSVCFSSDNSKLYGAGRERGSWNRLYQFDLSSNDTSQMAASKQEIATSSSSLGMQRGPDGKIYCAEASSLSVIHQPNFAGIACNYLAGDISLFRGTSSLTLVNIPTIVSQRTHRHVNEDTVFCADSFALKANIPSGIDYQWMDGSTGPTHVIYNSGTYWVSYQVVSSCIIDFYTDTFKVFFEGSRKKVHTTTTDSRMCKADSIMMQASNLNGSNYTWEDGSTGMTRKVNATGIYWLSYQIDSLCEDHVDSFIITYPSPEYKVSFLADSIICQDNILSFENTSHQHFNQFYWFFGDGNTSSDKSPANLYEQAGDYRIQLIGKINDFCSDTAYATITVDPLIEASFTIDRDSICAGESIRISHQLTSNTITGLHWDFGDGNRSATHSGLELQHAYEQQGIKPIGLQAQFRACPDDFYTDTIYVFGLPNVALGSDTSVCFNGQAIALRNLASAEEGLYHSLWNTGDTTTSILVKHPGTYSLTVRNEPLGCSTTESIEIKKDCYIDIPNAFTPDGDGNNDYFFPRQLLSKNISQFKMQILNRWGQLIFETTNVNGRGWDGKFNNKEQPQGVYLYLIEAEFTNGKKEHYEGNVTLIR